MQPTPRLPIEQLGCSMPCKWKECSETVRTVEEMVEHVNNCHIQTQSKDHGICDQAVCKWDGCKAAVSRGATESKIQWITNHFKTRHARAARMFACPKDQCYVRRNSQEEIEAHIKKDHRPKPAKKPASPQKVYHSATWQRREFSPVCVCDDSDTASDEEWTPAEYTSTSSDEEVTASRIEHYRRPNRWLPIWMHRTDPFQMPDRPHDIKKKKGTILSLEEKKRKTLKVVSEEYMVWNKMRKEKKIMKRELRAKEERQAELEKKNADEVATTKTSEVTKKRKNRHQDSGEPTKKRMKDVKPERRQPRRQCKSAEDEAVALRTRSTKLKSSLIISDYVLTAIDSLDRLADGLGYDVDGRDLPDKALFKSISGGAGFPQLKFFEEAHEMECIALWDNFGGNAYENLNMRAGDLVRVVSEEYPFFEWNAQKKC